ncbi:MAG: PAS domain S-box protein [Gammaproteobacteria bacterium]
MFLAFAECFSEAMLLLTRQGTVVAANRAGRELLGGIDTASISNHPLRDFVSDPDDKLTSYLAACAESDSPLTGVLKLRLADSIKQVICQGRGVSSSANRQLSTPVHGIILRCLPQTDHTIDSQAINASLLQLTAEMERRRLAEHRLTMTEAHAQAVLDTAVDGIVTIDSTGIIESFNNAAERLFEYRADEVIGKNISMLMPPPYCYEHDDYLQRYLSTGKKKIIGTAGREVTGLRKNGETFPMELAVSDLAFDGAHHFTGIVRDISRRKQAEQRLQQRELEARQNRERLVHVARLSTMGEMAAGIAHEINQPLTAIATYASASQRLLNSGLSDQDELLTTLDKISRQARRAGDVIQRLRSFVKKQDSQREVWDLNKLVADTMVLAEADARLHSFVIEMTLSQQPLQVSVDPIQIQQVLLNLIRNGMDAMLEAEQTDGCLRVGTRQADHDFALVSVRDQGVGISTEQSDKLFSPFFTTKSNGIGLGLSISRSIINAHGGRLNFERHTEEKGVTMYFTLPLEVGNVDG